MSIERIEVIINTFTIATSTSGIGIAPAAAAASLKDAIKPFAFLSAYLIKSFFESNELNNDVLSFKS